MNAKSSDSAAANADGVPPAAALPAEPAPAAPALAGQTAAPPDASSPIPVPVPSAAAALSELTERSRAIFRQLVETYLESGDPVGSRTLSKKLKSKLSPASIRNVMQDLEQFGLLDSPHASAGRRPTHLGLRLFVDAMLEVGDVPPDEERLIRQGLAETGRPAFGDRAATERLMDHAGEMLSGLAGAASLVLAPKTDAPIKHIDFVGLSENQILVVLVREDNQIENRLIDAPVGLTPSAMHAAANYLNDRLRGRTLGEAQDAVSAEIDARRRELGEIASRLVEAGLADWRGGGADVSPDRLIVRGRANLLTDGELAEDVERMRQLFEDLERKQDLAQLIDLTDGGEGVRVFIGAENKLFSLSGSSLIIAPYMNADQRVVGALGVIGPTRMNYGRIVPIVDYTAKLMGRLVSEPGPSGG